MPLTYLDDGNLDQTDIAAYSTMEVSWLLQDDLNFSYETFPSFTSFKLIVCSLSILLSFSPSLPFVLLFFFLYNFQLRHSWSKQLWTTPKYPCESLSWTSNRNFGSCWKYASWAVAICWVYCWYFRHKVKKKLDKQNQQQECEREFSSTCACVCVRKKNGRKKKK